MQRSEAHTNNGYMLARGYRQNAVWRKEVHWQRMTHGVEWRTQAGERSAAYTNDGGSHRPAASHTARPAQQQDER